MFSVAMILCMAWDSRSFAGELKDGANAPSLADQFSPLKPSDKEKMLLVHAAPQFGGALLAGAVSSAASHAIKATKPTGLAKGVGSTVKLASGLTALYLALDGAASIYVIENGYRPRFHSIPGVTRYVKSVATTYLNEEATTAKQDHK